MCHYTGITIPRCEFVIWHCGVHDSSNVLMFASEQSDQYLEVSIGWDSRSIITDVLSLAVPALQAAAGEPPTS
jgi:hypothetical protein